MRSLSGEELKTVYPTLFKEVFGFENTNEIPRIVLVHEDENGDIRGFVSGYMITKNTFYLAWGGIKGGLSFKGTRNYWKDSEGWFKENGVRFFETKVENTNTQWQRMLMGMGWIPHGVHAADSKLYIEYYKEL